MQEPCYFDGMHKTGNGWKALTLWVFHPSSRRLLRLATMKTKGDTAETTAIFWSTLNEMIKEVANDDKPVSGTQGKSSTNQWTSTSH